MQQNMPNVCKNISNIIFMKYVRYFKQNQSNDRPLWVVVVSCEIVFQTYNQIFVILVHLKREKVENISIKISINFK